MIVRRVDKERIEVLFDKPYRPDGRLGASLLELGASDPDVHVHQEGEEIRGVTCAQKTYLDWLARMDAPKAVITDVRRALDESKKAQRERMKGR